MASLYCYGPLGYMFYGVNQVPEDDTTCNNRCGEGYIPGLQCYCNADCIQYENCCYDYFILCAPDLVWTEDWNDFNNHSYKFFSDKNIPGSLAAAECTKHGSMLVSTNSAEEHDFLNRVVLKERVLSAYIGASDLDQEGIWWWFDGSPMPRAEETGWQVWYPDQPDDAGGSEDCGIMTNYKFWSVRKLTLDSFYWMDYSCDYNPQDIQGYICERTLACDPNPCQNNGTCQYIGGEEEFDCYCQDGFVGDSCEIALADYPVWTECGESLLVGVAGVVNSPLFPDDYPPNAVCNWTIRVDQGKTIKLEILHFDLESAKDCAFDWLAVYDGDSTNSSLLVPPSCGTLDNGTSTLTQTIFSSSSNEVQIGFQSDHSVVQSGFKLTYEEDECGLGFGDSGCNTRRRFESNCGSVKILTGPDVNGVCDWLIIVEPDHVINMTFNVFAIEDTDLLCENGGLVVYDGEDSTYDVIERYCGNRFSWSIISSGRYLYLQLGGLSLWTDEVHAIELEYEALSVADWTFISPVPKVSGLTGSFSSQSSAPWCRQEESFVYMWQVAVPIGKKMSLTWTLIASQLAHFTIFDGYSEFSGALVDLQTTAQVSAPITETTQPSGFQVLVRARHPQADSTFVLTASFHAIDWSPTNSPCYRPAFYSNPTSHGTENNLVQPLEPVMIMVSDASYDVINPGYDQGWYCVWSIEGASGDSLSLDFQDVSIVPKTSDCDYDGLVVYDSADMSGNKYGPFCGSSSEIQEHIIQPASSSLLIVFYSDPRGERRPGGIFRGLVKESESDCPIFSMDTDLSLEVESSCGVILSPDFPGTVEPNLWFWTIDFIPSMYHVVYVYYVRAPGSGDETQCDEFFRILEISRDANELRQYESKILTVCAYHTLFVPDTRFRAPPGNKLGVELNTLRDSISRIWEFKLSFEMYPFEEPVDFTGYNGTSSTNFTCYRGQCYSYIPWAYRHLEETAADYPFLETWQRSEEYCQQQGATLVNINDQAEADYLKFLMSTYWFWDTGSTWQINHRMIYIGLHNKYGHYQWSDDTSVAYTDWYIPPEVWEQPVLHEDTPDLPFLDVTNTQPNADEGSLCTVLTAISPFQSLNWAKIPCDYPIFFAGAICERPDLDYITNNTAIPTQIVSGTQACDAGWIMVQGRCLRLLTDYTYIEPTSTNTTSGSSFGVSGSAGLGYTDAERMCEDVGGHLADVDGVLFDALRDLLLIWRHTPDLGHVMTAGTVFLLNYISVTRQHPQDETILYTMSHYGTLEEDDMMVLEGVYSVLCETLNIEINLACSDSEFQCDNGVCVSPDHRCDSQDDCMDGSDERNCDDLYAYIECDGHQLPISLYCDFIPHCEDGRDEDECVYESCSEFEFQCRSGQCIDRDLTCNFYQDCFDGSDEDPDTCDGVCDGFQCYSGRCLPTMLHRDLVADCPGVSLEDELADIETLTFFDIYYDEVETNETFINWCEEGSDYVQCRQGEPRCYPRGSTCIYDDVIADEALEYVVQSTCRTGDHLREKCDVIECPGMFHCPSSYCVHYDKVCNGVFDCIGMQDEANCGDYVCPGMFHCKGENFCVPREKVCDGHVNCPRFKEDEKYCTQVDVLCDGSCHCDGLSLKCPHGNMTSLAVPAEGTRRQLRSMELSNNELILEAHSLRGLHWLAKLTLRYNAIDDIPIGTFLDLRNLQNLDLSHNQIPFLRAGIFQGLGSLQVLDLSYNRLDDLTVFTFPELTGIQHLILVSNPMEYVELDTFTVMESLSVLNTDDYKFCCISQQVEVCTPEADAFSSCEDLMANYALQISIWVLGAVACAGNLGVIAWRVRTDRTKVSSFFIINLGISDFLMGVYMLIIASVDVYYRGVYIMEADRWRSSWLCQTAGILAMLSSEASVFMMTAITADRMLAILFPLKMGSFRLKHAKGVALAGWITCFFLSVLPTFGIPYFGDAFFGRTGVCLPFQVSNEKDPGWEFSVFIFLVVNFISFLFILFGYVAIFSTVKTSMKEMGEKSTSTTNEYDLAKKLAVVVASDFLCWVPIILIGFAALAGAPIPPVVSAWIAVFVLPLNSAMNPILYTFSALDCKGAAAKRRKAAAYSSTVTRSTAVTKMASESVAMTTTKASKGDNPSAGSEQNGHSNPAYA